MQAISSILYRGDASKYKGVTGRVNHEFQVTALHIIKRLNIPRPRYSAYFGAVKRERPQFISAAFSFAVDHPIVEARDKMFFWKLNDLKSKLPIDNKL